MDAVGEEDDEELAVAIDPDAGAGKAGVAEALGREIVAAAASFGRDGPSESAGAAGKFLRLGELRDRGATQNAVMGVGAAVEQHLAEGGEVGGGAKKAGVAGDAPEDEGVFVVDFALD